MTMRAHLSLAAAAILALVGCNGPKGTAEARGSSGGGGLLHDIQSEMLASNKPTREGVALDVYFDVSGSSTNLKKPLGKLLERVADTYPEAVPYTYSFYGQSADLQGSGVSNVQSFRRATKAWVASKKEDKTTSLGEALRRLRERAEADPETQFAGIVVSDGGFEDAPTAKVELRKLREVPNVRYLAFVGVHTGDNPKLQRLTELTGGGDKGLQIHLVTDANNESSIQEARDGLHDLIAPAKKAG